MTKVCVTRATLIAILDYLEDDEKKNWEEMEKPDFHIYHDIRELRKEIRDANTTPDTR